MSKVTGEVGMSDSEFRAVLDWFMCSDPWPIEDGEVHHDVIKNMIDQESKRRGFSSWVAAFHYFEVTAMEVKKSKPRKPA